MLSMTTSFTALLCLASATLAQNLTFIRPRFSGLRTNEDGLPQLTAGENVTIEWQSDFRFTTLLVYQEVETDIFRQDLLAQGARRDKTEVEWKVGALSGSNGLGGSFHFELRNAVDADCEGCTLNSDNFAVSRRSASWTAISVPSQTATPTAQTGESTETSAPALAGAQNTATAEATAPSGSNDDLRIGLGVGLGVGIPLLLAAIGLIFFCTRRRRNRRDSLPRGRQPSPAQSSDRASGAWLYQDGRQSQQSILFRPSTSAPSEMTSFGHRSWIEPFDFERAETRDQDAISQLRQSIYSNSRSSRVSQVSLSDMRSERGGGALMDIPEQPQPAHHDGRGRPVL